MAAAGHSGKHRRPCCGGPTRCVVARMGAAQERVAVVQQQSFAATARRRTALPLPSLGLRKTRPTPSVRATRVIVRLRASCFTSSRRHRSTTPHDTSPGSRRRLAAPPTWACCKASMHLLHAFVLLAFSFRRCMHVACRACMPCLVCFHALLVFVALCRFAGSA